jgi:drug/metabolite transporter (DMT)-like permease
MTSRQALWLFVIPSFIWGSTWYAITFQLGKVDPIVSVAYRSALAGIVLILYSLFTKRTLKFTLNNHFFMFLQGIFLFGINYWFVYLAETHITSGLVAILFSLIIVMNIIFSNIFLKHPINKSVVLAALLGITGTAVVFYPELKGLNSGHDYYSSVFICLTGVVLASLGNIVASYNNKNGIPIVQSNAFGMVYGAIALFIVAFFIGKPINFDFTFQYISSLVYLALFGSVVAFNTYLKLMSMWGPGKAAYIVLVTPVIAVFISFLLEDYHLSVYSLIGAILVLGGNYLIVRKKKEPAKVSEKL